MADFLSLALLLMAAALLLIAAALGWLALEVRLARCGKVHPRVVQLLSPTDRMEWRGTEPRPDYV